MLSLAIVIPLLVVLGALTLARRRSSRVVRWLINLSAPGVSACLGIVPYALASMTFGPEPVRIFVSRSIVVQLVMVAMMVQGFIAPITTLAAVVVLFRTSEALPRYVTVLVVTSMLGAAAFWTLFVYFITHFGI